MKFWPLVAAIVGGSLALTACAQHNDDLPPAATTATRPAASETIPVVLDYSPTVSDVGALLYLAQHPRVELLGVTIAGTGESHCDAAVKNTTALLALTEQSDVPVACGPTEPIGAGATWPAAWRDDADALGGLELLDSEGTGDARDAVELLVDLVESSETAVTIVALAPLTNLAAAFEQEPEIVSSIERVYTMGGAFDVAGNAPNGTAEWNFAVDPAAVSVVLDSGAPVTMVPLDATDDVPVTREFFDLLETQQDTAAATAIYDLMNATKPFDNGFFFWDEFTAALVFDDLSSISDMNVSVVTTGNNAGRTERDEDGAPVRVAVAGDRPRFERAFLGTLTGTAPGSVELEPDEKAYFAEMQAATESLTAAIEQVYAMPLAQELESVLWSESPVALDPATEARVREFLTLFWNGFVDAAATHHDDLAMITAPDSLRADHDAYVAAVAALIATRDQRLAEIATTPGAELTSFLMGEFPEVAAVEAACGTLTTGATARGVVDPVCPR